MDGYVSKPIRPHELFAEINRLLPATVSPVAKTIPAATAPGDDRIDRSALLKSLGGNPQFLSELSEVCLTECAQLAGRIEQALKSEDLETVARAAHTLKGAVATFESSAVYQAAEKLETYARTGRLDQAQGLYEELLRELQDFMRELREIPQWLANSPAGPRI